MSDRRMIKRTLCAAATMLALGLSLLCPTRLLACPSCKDHLAANGLDFGYAVSILIMILIPMAIVATWVVLILRLRSIPQPNANL